MNLGYDYYYKIIQKDVNNYIALGEYNVFVGGYVKDLNELDYDLPVINKAIREYFINGTTPEEYIYNETRLIEFQKIVKVSNKYECAIHNGTKQPEKTLRVFASNRDTDGVVYKYRKNQTAKFANTSEKVFIDNGNVKNKQAPSFLDKSWYINLAWKRINQFMGD